MFYVTELLSTLPTLIIIIILIGSLYILSKAADRLIDEAVALSLQFGLSKMVVGATILSVGTTLPEVASSLAASLRGNSLFGLGNAVGSIITNASLILGIGALIGLIPVKKETRRTFLVFVGSMLGFMALSLISSGSLQEGLLPRWSGFLLLLLAPIYIWQTVKKNPKEIEEELEQNKIEESAPSHSLSKRVVILIVSSLSVTIGAALLVASAEITAVRIGIPDSIIASTLVAFGTSVPEISTTLVAVRYGHGEMAIGNILGANMMNILLVMGAVASLTPGGVLTPASYITVQYPIILVLMGLIGFPLFFKKRSVINRRHGFALILLYTVYLLTSFLV